MAIHAGVGMSHHRNPKIAGQEAVKKALAAAGISTPDFVFMFASAGYDQQSLLNAVNEATGGAPLSGCSGEGIIAGGEADESNFSVGVMVIRSDQIHFSNGVATGLQEDSARSGRTIAEALQSQISSANLALFVFPDGITVNFDRLLAGLEEQLNLDRLLPLVGGLASTIPENPSLGKTYQYYNDSVVSDGVAYALLSGQAQLAWAFSHGCVPVGIEHTISRCEGNIIYEIDGKPALELLKEYVTDDELKNELMKVALTFTFGLKAPGYMQAYDDYIIRGMRGIDDVAGSITLPVELSEGTSIWMMRREYEKISQSVDKVTEEITHQIGDNKARLVFQFDCHGRGKVFLREQQKRHLLESLRGRIGRDAPWLGFYCFGEIAPAGGRNSHHNYTVALAAMY